MSGDDLEDFYVHEVTVETHTGGGGWGDTYGTRSDPVPCFVDDTHRLTRDQSGAETVSTATVYAPIHEAALFTVGSRVHLEDRVAEVISRNKRTGGDLDLPDHVEVTLT